MAPFCLNSATQACVISWSFIRDALSWFGIALVFFIAISVMWTLADRCRLGFSRWRAVDGVEWWHSLPWQVRMSWKIVSEVVPSLFSCVVFVYRASSRTVDLKLLVAETVLISLFTLNDLVKWFFEMNRIRATFYPARLVHLLALTSHLVLLSRSCDWPTSVWSRSVECVDVSTGITARTWFTFGYLRSVYVNDSLDLFEFLLASPWFKENVPWLMFRSCVRFLLIMFIAGVTIMSIELAGEPSGFANEATLHTYECIDGSFSDAASPECSSEVFSLFPSMYFMMVTLATIGYGDFSPVTTIGRLFVICVILFGIVIFATQIAHLQDAVESDRKGRGRYDPRIMGPHVVVVGDPSVSQIREFLKEFYHPDHGVANGLKTLFLVHEDPQDRIRDYLSRCPYNVTFKLGFAIHAADLHRAAVEDCEAVFILPDKYAPNALQTDSLSLSLAISIRHYLTAVAPGLLKRESVVALAQRWLNEHLYRSRKRMGKRVQRSTGLKLFGMNDFLDAETSLLFHKPIVMLLRLAENREHAVAAGIPSRHVICVDELSSSLLANAAMHPGVATLVCNLITSRSLDVLPSLEPWAIEYAAGAAKEVYSLRLRPSFEGLTFPLAALTIFLETKGQVQLLGFQIRGHDNKLHTELVPDDSHIYERDARAFVLAPDARSVKRLKSDLPISASKAFATPSHIGRSSPSSRDLFATPYLNLHFKTPHISRRPAPSLSPLAPHADGQGNSGGANPPPLNVSDARLEGLESKRSFTATMSFHKATPAHGSRAYHLAAETVALEIARIKLAQAPAAPPHSVILNGHHLLLVCQESIPFSSLHHFVRQLVKFGAYEALVILHPRQPEKEETLYLPRRILERSGTDVYFIKGSPLSFHDLVRAGVHSASMLVLCTGIASATDEACHDAQTVFTHNLVTSRLGPRAPHIVVALAKNSSVPFISMCSINQNASCNACPKDDTVTYCTDAVKRMIDGTDDRLKSSGASDFADLSVERETETEQTFIDRSFARGKLFTRSVVESLVANVYFEDHIATVVKRLITSRKNALAMVAVPSILMSEDSTATFEAVYEFLLKTFGFVAIGIYRHGISNLPINALVPIEVFCYSCTHPVQTAAAPRPFAAPYVYAAPDADAKVTATDVVYVLMNHQNETMYTIRILKRFGRFLRGLLDTRKREAMMERKRQARSSRQRFAHAASWSGSMPTTTSLPVIGRLRRAGTALDAAGGSQKTTSAEMDTDRFQSSVVHGDDGIPIASSVPHPMDRH